MSAQKPEINLSLNPSYYCNFRCSFCYLTEQQLSDRTVLSLDVVVARVDELLEHFEIGHVDIYGGEVLLLPEDYLLGLKDIFLERGIDDIVIVTNLSHVPDIVHDPDIKLSVSYDFTAREKSEKVFENIFLLSNRFVMLTLASREFLDNVTPDEYVNTLASLPHLWHAEIKPYSSNQANDQPVSFKEFEEFVWAVIKHPNRNFTFENEWQLTYVVKGERNAYSDDHIYITPSGDFAVLEFDSSDREYFKPVEGVKGYLEWCEVEKSRVSLNAICNACPYYGKCLSEHLREVVAIDESCNGFRNLIERWEKEQ